MNIQKATALPISNYNEVTGCLPVEKFQKRNPLQNAIVTDYPNRILLMC